MGLFILEIDILIFCIWQKTIFAKNEHFNFENKKSHVKKFYNFQLFVGFSTDSECLAIKFFESGFKYAYTFV